MSVSPVAHQVVGEGVIRRADTRQVDPFDIKSLLLAGHHGERGGGESKADGGGEARAGEPFGETLLTDVGEHARAEHKGGIGGSRRRGD